MRGNGGVVLSRYWRPAEWFECQEPAETDLRKIVRGWGPGTHGEGDPGFSLQTRDTDVLTRLWAAGPLLTDHIHRLFWAEAKQDSVITARLRRLWDLGLLRRHRPVLERGMGSSPYLWAISKRGFDLLLLLQPLWWTARWPHARWDSRQDNRQPGPELAHGLVVADVAAWAVATQGREWVFESEPASIISAGVVQVGPRTKQTSFKPDAILTRDGAPSWFIEVERAAYLPTWRAKTETWLRWAKRFGMGNRVPAQIVVVGYLKDAPERQERSILPLLRVLPADLAPHVLVLDLDRWDPLSPEVPFVLATSLRAA